VSTTLVATLGGQPQIITFTLDLLLAREEHIDQVVVVFPSTNERYSQAYRKLAAEFPGDIYTFGKCPCHFRAVPIRIGELPVEDAFTPRQVAAVHETLYRLLRELKAQGQQIHLSLSGGRRIMSLLALEAAMQYFTPTDQIWHIFTPELVSNNVRDGSIMHLPTESGVQLISVPFVPWAAYFPGLAPLLGSSPRQMREATLGWLDDADRRRCTLVWQALTPRRRDTLRAFAQGMSRAQVAKVLCIAISTVDSHRQAIIDTCEDVWGEALVGDADLFFVQRFGPFIKGLD
jgi:CRISPR-associated protein Csx14